MQLITDHPQFYDGIFDDRPPVFHRMAFTRGGFSKVRQYELFESLGMQTPPHGSAAELAAAIQGVSAGIKRPDQVLEDYRCVVYLDEYAHRGEGKSLLPLREAILKHPHQFASLFIPPGDLPLAYRLVRFGRLAFWIRQQGRAGEWRSNQHDEEAILSKQGCPESNPIPRVLWAIDFIPGPQGLLAVDFNTAPQLVTLGESGALTNEEVACELEHAARQHPDHLNQF